MDSKKNIRIMVLMIIILALGLQISRRDNFFVGNFNNEKATIDESLIYTEALNTIFESDDSFAVYYDKTNEESNAVKENVDLMLSDTKKDFKVYDINVNNQLDYSKKTIVIAFSKLSKIQSPSRLLEYVETGGSLIVLMTPESDATFSSLARMMGFAEFGSPISSEGIKFNEKLFPGYKADEIKTVEVSNYLIPATISEDCEIYMTSSKDHPILWSRDFKKGHVVVYNGSILADKIMIGIINRTFALSKDAYIYPIINTKVMFLDDFPSPSSNEYFDEIKKIYGKTIKEFYIDVWWPKMLMLGTTYDIEYTAAMINTYNDRTEPPFEDPAAIAKNELIVLGKEIIKSGGELGLHGYNHQSLTLEAWKMKELEYQQWPSTLQMEEALENVRFKLADTFPKYEVNTYVPPSNVIGKEGIKSLKKVFPKMNVIASVFYKDYQSLNYTQNFSYEDGVINLPRFSSGYTLRPANRIAILNGIFAYGTFSHFIHPDDFMDEERSEGLPWLEQLKSYEELLKLIDGKYGYMRAQTATEAATEIAKYIGLDYVTNYDDLGIHVQTNAKNFPIFMQVRSVKELGEAKGCEYSKIGEFDYIVKVNQKSIDIDYKR